MVCSGAGARVVLLDEEYLRSTRAMWELGVMMAATATSDQPQPRSSWQTARTVLPVVLMDLDAVTATYEEHWTPAAVEQAHREGLPPATLADVHRLLGHQGVRQDQVRAPHSALCHQQLDALRVLLSSGHCNASRAAEVQQLQSGLQRLSRRPGQPEAPATAGGYDRPSCATEASAPGSRLEHAAQSQRRDPAIWTLSRAAGAVVGREGEIKAVLTSLQQHGSAVIWGGPGEGKATVAMEAAARLRVDEPDLHAFALNMRGEHFPLLWDYAPSWIQVALTYGTHIQCAGHACRTKKV